MKKSLKILSLALTAALSLSLLAGCSGNSDNSEETVAETAAEEVSESVDETVPETAIETAEETAVETESEEAVTVHVGSLSGPTTIGLVNLMNDVSTGANAGDYEFTVSTQPSEIAASLNAGDLDIALIPANLAATLYNRTEGAISVIDINTYGVLYCITADTSVTSIEDLAGKTVITTGQGATPEYAMNYLLEQYGVEDCTLDFKSEATEVLALMQEDPTQIAVLPQPAATAAGIQNSEIQTAFSLDECWNALDSGSRLITGVTVVRNDFLAEHPDAVNTFIEDQAASVAKASEDIEGTAELVVAQGIVAAAPVAAKAIPLCNIACVTGEQMKTELSGYLQTLFDANSESVGGALPADDFYYVG